MSVFGLPTRQACQACPGVAFNFHKAHEITTSDKDKLVDFLRNAGLLSMKRSGFPLVDRIKERLKAYIKDRLGKYIGADFPVTSFSNLQESIGAAQNSVKFDTAFRLYTHAQGAHIEYIRCTADGTSRMNATRVVVDTYNGTRWVELFSKPLVELDNDMNYILLNESDQACIFYEKPGAELLAKITKHEAESFMSKHGLREDMAAMGADMVKDYRDLMHNVAREGGALGLML
jgi:hypothetical protein